MILSRRSFLKVAGLSAAFGKECSPIQYDFVKSVSIYFTAENRRRKISTMSVCFVYFHNRPPAHNTGMSYILPYCAAVS